MTWLKAQFDDGEMLAALLERVVADSRTLPSGSRAQVHVCVDPVRRELYCDGAALAVLNALIALQRLDEVAMVPQSGTFIVLPERGEPPRRAIASSD